MKNNFIKKTPLSLYKYLPFSENSLNVMCRQLAYYSDPVYFNDPLDCQPVITNDLNHDQLRELLSKLLQKKAFDERLRDLRRLYRGKQFVYNKDSIESTALEFAKGAVAETIMDIEYNATHPEVDDKEGFLTHHYINGIQAEVVNAFRKGVLCLSAKFNSPLMWSHYAHQHKGICIEYDMQNVDVSEIHKVVYGGSRKLATSEVKHWLENPEDDTRMKEACLLTKSEEWRYESEWRIFGPVGLKNSLPPIKSIIFGLKCDDTTMYTVMKALTTPERTLKFWKISNEGDKFKLKRTRTYLEYFDGELPCLYSDADLNFAWDDLSDAKE